ncbi:MAG: hypothetical protein ACPGVU_14480, partial [Limisphaerales bacterium]
NLYKPDLWLFQVFEHALVEFGNTDTSLTPAASVVEHALANYSVHCPEPAWFRQRYRLHLGA